MDEPICSKSIYEIKLINERGKYYTVDGTDMEQITKCMRDITNFTEIILLQNITREHRENEHKTSVGTTCNLEERKSQGRNETNKGTSSTWGLVSRERKNSRKSMRMRACFKGRQRQEGARERAGREGLLFEQVLALVFQFVPIAVELFQSFGNVETSKPMPLHRNRRFLGRPVSRKEESSCSSQPFTVCC